MTTTSDFERQLENVIYAGFPEDDERADIVAQIRAIAEQAMPRACQSETHSPFACRYGGSDDGAPLWQCPRCRTWLCYAEGAADERPDVCDTCWGGHPRKDIKG
jgi:hypothetical protein